MAREDRLRLIQEIEQQRESKVITYVTNDRPNLGFPIIGDVVSIIHEHLLEIGDDARSKIDLFIYSRGGASDIPWTIVSMIREYSAEGSFSVLIPYRAHSAATMIALGADEMIMTRKAELGPIDITIERGPHNPIDEDTRNRLPISVEDVMGFFSLLKKVECKSSEQALSGFSQLAAEVHPLALGHVSRLLAQTELVALRLLETRADAFSARKNKRIVQRLSSEIYSHLHTISRTEALEYLGLDQVIKAEDVGLHDEIWSLYCEYRDLFELEAPFRSEEHLIANDLDEHTWQGLNLACVESTARYDLCKKDLRIRRLRQVPPELQLDLSNLSIPQVQLPQLPQGITPQQFEQMVQQMMGGVIQPIINNAVSAAIDSILRSLPSAGFEQFSLNGGWTREA